MVPDKVTRPEDLAGLDKDGLIAFLKNDRKDKIDLWNAWRRVDHKEPVNLGGADLRASRLNGADLRAAILEGARLEEANLSEAELSGANLSEARLEGATLSGARLDGAILCGARLRDVDLSSVASINEVRLFQTNFWGMHDIHRDQFVGGRLYAKGLRGLWLELVPHRLYKSTIWEENEGHFREAKDVYKRLKGFSEDAGNYETANWAYMHEKVMEKLMRVPPGLRWLYPRWRVQFKEDYCEPNLIQWLRLEFSDKIANYGLSLGRPLVWLTAIIIGFAMLYLLGGMVTNVPDCGYPDLGCQPTHNFMNNLLFSLASMVTTEIGWLQPTKWSVGLFTTFESLLGIALTGLFGFVLGNKLRYS